VRGERGEGGSGALEEGVGILAAARSLVQTDGPCDAACATRDLNTCGESLSMRRSARRR